MFNSQIIQHAHSIVHIIKKYYDSHCSTIITFILILFAWIIYKTKLRKIKLDSTNNNSFEDNLSKRENEKELVQEQVQTKNDIKKAKEKSENISGKIHNKLQKENKQIKNLLKEKNLNQKNISLEISEESKQINEINNVLQNQQYKILKDKNIGVKFSRINQNEEVEPIKSKFETLNDPQSSTENTEDNGKKNYQDYLNLKKDRKNSLKKEIDMNAKKDTFINNDENSIEEKNNDNDKSENFVKSLENLKVLILFQLYSIESKARNIDKKIFNEKFTFMKNQIKVNIIKMSKIFRYLNNIRLILHSRKYINKIIQYEVKNNKKLRISQSYFLNDIKGFKFKDDEKKLKIYISPFVVQIGDGLLSQNQYNLTSDFLFFLKDYFNNSFHFVDQIEDITLNNYYSSVFSNDINKINKKDSNIQVNKDHTDNNNKNN